MRIKSILVTSLLVVSCLSQGGDALAANSADAWFRLSDVAQNSEIRSRNDVVQEVKRRYNAKVLRIELSRDQSVYHVRILMPDGKVRNLSINARR